jgi:hypothetical protein
MADQTTTVPMEVSDSELFKAAMDNEPQQEAVEREPEPREQPRDESGRFAAKTEPEPEAQEAQPEPAQQPPTDDDKSGQVPSWRLREVREAREAAERRADQAERERAVERQQFMALQREIEQLRRPKAEPVDFFQNPDEAFQQRVTPLQERQAAFESQLQFRMSRTMAIAEHGIAAVKEMEEAVKKANREGHPELPSLSAQMNASDDPVSVAMNWHKRSKLLDETGGDLAGYRQKTIEEALNDPAFLAKAVERARAQAQGNQSRPSVQLPPSLNKATGSAATTNGQQDAADMSDAGLFRHAMGNRR